MTSSMARRPYVRTRADERAVLAADSTEGLALRIVEIGESMQRTEARMEKERQKTAIDAASLEAHHLAQTRADLLAIAAEINHRVRALVGTDG